MTGASCIGNAGVLVLILLSLSLQGCRSDVEKPASNMAAAREAKKERAELRKASVRIEPFFKPMGKPDSSDWLASHNEPGQTFDEYLDAEPSKPTADRQKIYILPLGTFTTQQKKTVDSATEYLSVFYDLPVQEMRAVPLAPPRDAVRIDRSTKRRQVLTTYIINSILRPRLPPDAAAMIALTTEDLYPGEALNYVFGQASLDSRVGVWSLNRLDDNANDQLFLTRTLKIAAHETGHMFSMRHCTKFECVMSGTNHLAETDRRPIDACPECMAKVCWLSEIMPADRYKRLAAFCRSKGLMKEAQEFERKAVAVSPVD